MLTSTMHRQQLAATLIMLLPISATPATAEWEKLNVPTTASLRGLSVVTADVVWASGTGGTVIRTIDGGKRWSVMIVPGAENLDFRGIRAFDDNTALIMSSGPAEKGQARIYRTMDGGKNWKQVFAENRPGIFFDAIAFWDRRHGILLSDPVDGKFALFATEDGGSNWKQLPPTALPPALPNEGAFAASNSCLAVHGKNDVWFGTGGANVARVFHSSDRGKTWSVAETPVHPANSSSGIFSLAFLDSKNGIAVGGDYQHPEKSNLPNIIQSRNSGRSWRTGDLTDPPGVYFSSVAPLFPYPDTFLAVGTRGAFIFRNSWLKATDQELNAATVTRTDFVVWAVGPHGTVARTELIVDFRPASKNEGNDRERNEGPHLVSESEGRR